MEVRTLRVFVEVVRRGGFSSAAAVLESTQSAVSKAVKALEDEVGQPLLVRTGRSNTLTAAGEIVYRRAVRLLAERDDMLSELDNLRGLRRGVLKLGLSPIGSSTLFAPLFAIYRQRYPNVEIRLVEHGSHRLRELLRNGEIELGAAMFPPCEELDQEVVRREPLMVVVPHTHTLATRASLSLAEVAHLPFILFDNSFTLNRIIGDACTRAGFEPEVIARSAQVDFIVELVAAGVGIGFLPESLARNAGRRAIRPIKLDDEDTDWFVAVAWRRDAYVSHAARAWLEVVREVHRPLSSE